MRHLSRSFAAARPVAIAPLLLATTLLVPDLSAQLTMQVCTKGIGQPTTYALDGGRRGFPFLFLTSFQRANIPLSPIDPRDTRSLGVGFDLLALLLVGNFDANGRASFALPIPNDTSLIGKALLHQAIGYPGITTTFGDLTDVAVVPLDVRGAWKLDPAKNMFFGRAWTTVLDEGDGKYLVAAGGTGALLALQAFDTSDRFDLATRSFTAGPKLTVARGVHTASPLPGGRSLLVGGVDAQNDPQATSEIYDPAKGAFSTGPAMAFKRMAHTATVLKDGRVFVTGGLSDLNGQLAALGSALSTTEIYDPVTNKWTRGPDMAEPKAGHGAILLGDGRVLLAGGVTWRNIIFIKVPSFSKLVDVYDPATGKMSALRALGKERAGFSIFRLGDDRVLVAGGIGGSIVTGGTADSSCELFDPKANRWSATGAMLRAKALGSAVTLADGSPAVLGGAIGSLLAPLAVDDCVAFDVKTGTWSALPKLVTPRATHSALRTASCPLVVIGGGSGTSGAAVKTAELLIR